MNGLINAISLSDNYVFIEWNRDGKCKTPSKL